MKYSLMAIKMKAIRKNLNQDLKKALEEDDEEKLIEITSTIDGHNKYYKDMGHFRIEELLEVFSSPDQVENFNSNAEEKSRFVIKTCILKGYYGQTIINKCIHCARDVLMYYLDETNKVFLN